MCFGEIKFHFIITFFVFFFFLELSNDVMPDYNIIITAYECSRI